MKNFFQENKKLIFIFGVLLNVFLASLILLVGAYATNALKQGRFIGQEIKHKNTITVYGKGEVYTKPDLAKISFSVKTEAKTVKQAIAANTNKMNDIISVLEQEGISKKDLKTTNFSIYPRYEWQKQAMPVPIDGKRILAGYEVSQTLEVKIRDLDKIGKVIQEATKAGANQIGNLQFLVDKKEEFEKEARNMAIKQAKQKAKDIASSLGIRLGRIVNFSENTNEPVFYLRGAASYEENKSDSSPQIEPGQNKIQSRVSISYEIE